MTEETLQRGKEIREELIQIERFLESSSSEYSMLELIKEKAEFDISGDAYTVSYKCRFKSEIAKKIVELLKVRKAELEAEFEKL